MNWENEEYRKTLEIANRAAAQMGNSLKVLSNINKIPIEKLKFMGEINRIVQMKELASLFQNFNYAIESINSLGDLFRTVPFPLLSEKALQFLEEMREAESLSEEEFEEKYQEEIKVSRSVGRAGWVVSKHINPKTMVEWELALKNNEVEKVVNIFIDNNGSILEEIIANLKGIYISESSKLYYSKGLEAFNNKDYMTATMYWVPLLEVRVNQLVAFPKEIKSYKKKYSDVGFKIVKEEQFSQKSSIHLKRYRILHMFPSLIEYLNRMFVDGEYKFEDGKEPPYLNRNWLLHGRCSKEPEYYACIQVLNALDTLEWLLNEE